MESQQRRGRLYACLHCSGKQVTYIAERYRVIDHIQKHHLALDQAAFYCNLCMFRCLTREQLEKHLTGYKRHVMMASTPGIGDVRRYLVINPNPRKIVEGVDYRLASLEDQTGQQFRHVDPFDERTSFVEAPKKQDLVTIRVTPDVLASLTTGYSPKVPASSATVPAPVVQQPRYDPLKPGLHDVNFDDLLSTPDQHLTLDSNLSFGPSSTYIPTPQNSSLSAFRPVTPNTPVMSACGDDLPSNRGDNNGKEENILDQILGTNTPMTFSPRVPQQTEAPMRTTKKDAVCQTTPYQDTVVERFQPLTATIGHLEKTLEVSLGKVTFAMESNARATRHLGQSLESMAESLKTLARSVEKMVDDQRKARREGSSHRAEKRPRLDDKENSPVLKSVVNKKNNKN